MSGSGATESVWLAGSELPARTRLEGNAKADVCVIGAGITGLTTAYLIARAGRRVIVLEDGRIGSGETSRTTAHLVTALDDRYSELARLHGDEGARLAAESHAAAIDQIEKIVAEERIECDFVRLDGYLFVPPGDAVSILDEELAAARNAGVAGVTKIDRAPLPSFDTGPCLRFPRQAQFHPLKYLASLAKAFEARGGRICTGTHAKQITGGRDASVRTTGGAAVSAGSIVVATNTPVNDIVTIHTKQAAYRTFVVGLPVAAGSVPRALYWDTPDPYHYVRLAGRDDRGAEILIVGGEDHKTGQADDAEQRFSRLEAWARERFPISGPRAHAWSGQIMEPVDSLAFIGRNPGDADNVFIATGDSGNGMTHGTIAGMLITDLILGKKNPWASLYDPSRITIKAVPDFAKENLNVAAQYADLVTGGEIASVEQLPRDSGAIMRRGIQKVAVYRDAQGVVHERSAVCTHLGCIVQWNHTEKTWDCPCHGSRFAPLGEVLNGPAIKGLAPAD
jgi:glycine/D-amino acid oxidase-like deaminating enzyme/nitrite reductase/ring-hydroxylating ferredoxin subunit